LPVLNDALIVFKVMSSLHLLLEDFTMTLLGWLRENNGYLARRSGQGSRSTAVQRGATIPPRLEHLEDRLSPTNFLTTTNVAISITPNVLTRTANETITATVTQQGTATPVTNGTVAFNVNNQMATAGLNSNGQAIFSVSLPLFAVATNQTLQVNYQGATVGSDTFDDSVFLSPVYLNLMNEFLPSQITYGTPTSTTSFQSSGGETNNISFFGLAVKFNYIDPGRIQTIAIGGFTFPGVFATAFGIQQLG
jgi:hypothetical protein